MSSERHGRVKVLFLAACDLGGAERRAFLARECGADEALLREVEEMIGVDVAGVPALERPAHGPGTAAAPGATDQAELRRLVERAAAREYVVKCELARGGMGAILCVHDPGLRRDLAMKVSLRQLRARSDAPSSSASASELARFLEEAQITAQLDHPGIVPVHDLGVDAAGGPARGRERRGAVQRRRAREAAGAVDRRGRFAPRCASGPRRLQPREPLWTAVSHARETPTSPRSSERHRGRCGSAHGTKGSTCSAPRARAADRSNRPRPREGVPWASGTGRSTTAAASRPTPARPRYARPRQASPVPAAA